LKLALNNRNSSPVSI